MSRIKALFRRVVIGLALAGLLLAMALHHWPLPAQAAQRLASAWLLKPLAKAKPSAEPYAAPFAALTVNSLEDTATPGDGKCTLREAINNANAAGQTTGTDCTAGTGSDTISFSVTGTINLASALPSLNSNVTINGPGPNQLDVHRNTGGDYRIFNINSGRTVSISGLKITNGNVPGGSAGGILSFGNLTLTNCVVAGNNATGNGGQGGGVASSGGTLTITNSEITGNNANNFGGILTINTPLVMTNSTLSNNKTMFQGAALNIQASNAQNVTTTLTNCTISGNISQNTQGGITSGASSGGTSSLTLTNCTVTGNTSVAPFGAIWTTSGDNNSTTVTRLKNTLVANNSGVNFLTNGPTPTATNATLTSLGNNLDSDGTSGFTNGVNGDIIGTANNQIDAKLGPLADNGGPTQTHALLSGSPAIDKGSAAAGVTTDQRGFQRPTDDPTIPNAAGGDGSDIGAVEAAIEGANFVVNDLGDTPDVTAGNKVCADSNGKCTLRAAIQEANALGTGQISFSVTGVINLTSVLPDINSNVTITGPGPNQLDVHRSTGGDYRIFSIPEGKTVNISGIKITNGKLSGASGGGLISSGTLSLTNCVISGNTASSGGGVYSGGTLSLTNCVISGNMATTSIGGGVAAFGSLTISNSALSDNTADTDGGGIAIGTGPLVMTNSTLSRNKAAASSALGMQNLTATLTNCTISGNTGQDFQGSITNAGFSSTSLLTLTNCTVAGNTGAGVTTLISSGVVATTRLKNTLVAANTGPNFVKSGANATFTSLGNNLDSDGTSGFINNVNGDIVGTAANKIDAKLGPLADNGGPTQTHLLLCASPAIDKGSNTGAPATDQRGVTRPVSGTVDIGAVEANPSLTINPATLPGGFFGKTYNQTLMATGGTAPSTFVATTALPSGLTLSAAGVLSGPAPAVGSYTFTAQVTDATGAQGCRTYTLVVGVCPTITVFPTTLPDIVAGREFSQNFPQSGATGAFTWTLTGNLPAGLSFNSQLGILVGTPTQPGTSAFTIRVTDVNGCFGERSYTLTVNCIGLTITPPLLSAGVLGVAYNQPLATSCGTAPITYAVSAGALSTGLTLSADGILSGTPTTVGLSIFTVRATAANNQTTTRSYTLPVYRKQMVTADDGAASVNFGRSVAIDGDFAIVGAPQDKIGTNSNQGSASIYVRNGATWTLHTKLTASDGAAADLFGYSVSISGNTVIVGAYADDVGANADQGSAYIFVRNEATSTWTQQAKIMASDGAANDQFGQSVAISSDTAIVGAQSDDIGANADQGSAYIFVRNGTTWTQQTKLTANDGAAGDLFGISVAINGETGIVGAYSDDVTNVNQGSAYIFIRNGTTWAQQAKLIANDGEFSDFFGFSVALSGNTALVGAPAHGVGMNSIQGSAYIFVRNGTIWTQQAILTASDGAPDDLFGYSVALSGDTAIAGSPADDLGANVNQGSAYIFIRNGTTWAQQAKFTASDGATNDDFAQSVALSGNTALVGVPFDNVGANVDQGSAQFFNLNLAPCPTLTITPTTLPGGTTGTAYNQTLTATGGSAPYSFVVSSGTLPAGLTLSSVGALSGTPTVAGTSNFTVTATDANGCTGAQAYTLVITAACPTITIFPATIPAATAGSSYSEFFVRSGGTPPITFSLTGALPAGLSFNVQTASFVGTPLQSGNFPITIRATDANGCFGERNYTLIVNCPASMVVSPPLLAAGALGVAYNQSLGASCGMAPFNFTVSAGALPAGLTLSAGGILSGTPTTTGLSIFTIQAMDANNQIATRSYTLPVYRKQTLAADDGAVGDLLGYSVSINGDTAIVGAVTDNIGPNVDQGSAYIYVRNGMTWTQQAKLTANDGAAGDLFGGAVAISGDTAVVGAPSAAVGANVDQGVAYVFVRSGTTWTQQAKLIAEDGKASDFAAFSIAISGETVIFGADSATVGANERQGSAYVFVRNGTTWTQQAKLTANDGAALDDFGYFVALSGDTAVIGAPFDDLGENVEQGSAYVFVRSGTTWTQQTKLTAGDGASGDFFGFSVAISGETVLVGAEQDDVGGKINQGSAYVFVRSGTTWTQQAQLMASDGALGDNFGSSVSLSGNTALIGANIDDLNTNSNQGSAYVFVRSGTTWTQQGQLVASDGATSDNFGFAVSLSDNTALVGSYTDDVGGNVDQGSVHFFDLTLATCPTLTINPATLPGGTVGAAYNQTVTATGGASNYNFTVTAGALPGGLTLSISGLLSGTPAASGSFNFTVTATDANGCTGTRSYTLTIAAAPTCIPVSISTSLSGATGSTLTVPIMVGDLTGKGVSAYDFTLTFDPTVIKPASMPVDNAGTLSSGLTVTPNTNTPGRITVSAFGANALTGAGTLLNLKFDLIGTTSACSNLTWLNFVFNEGTPCSTTSNGQVCITGGSISGTVNYATTTARPVPGVLLTAAGTPSATATTSSTGGYSLTGLGGGPYTVTPSKTGQVNGISSFDASLVAQHVAGLSQLTANQQIAADVSNNGSVSSFDASLISQTVAGIVNAGIAGIWKFVPANRSYPSLSGNQTEQDFIAVLVGDVSANWTPPAIGVAPDVELANHSLKTVADAANQIMVSLPYTAGLPGSIVTLPVKVSDLSGRGVVAYDFTLNYDPAVLQPQGAATDAVGTLSRDFQITTNTATSGRLTVSAFGAQALAGEGILLHLKFKVVGGAGTATTLTWPDFVFNEATPGAAPATGSFAVEMNGRGINVHANVSAASFRAGDLASGQIVSAFGVNLAARTEAAATLPLPIELAGTRVEITDSLGTRRTAPLFFVSPQQINYQIPADTSEGTATVMIFQEGNVVSTGLINIAPVAPALFTVNASGTGFPVAVVRRFRNDQEQFPSVLAAQLDAQNRWVPLPIDLSHETDLVILELFGTGLGFRRDLSAVSVKIGDTEGRILYAGEAPGFVGLDQIDVAIPRSLIGRGEVDVVLTVDGKTANTVKINIR